MNPRELKVGEIVQVHPGLDRFGACLVVVTEPKRFGMQGYVQNAGSDGQAYVRLKFEDIEPTGGHVEWIVGGNEP